MSYEINDYSFKQAKKLGVEIKPSTNKKKKVDIFREGKKISSIGATGYGDYSTYVKTKGKAYADKRRELYKIRHEKTSKIKGSPSWYATNILW